MTSYWEITCIHPNDCVVINVLAGSMSLIVKGIHIHCQKSGKRNKIRTKKTIYENIPLESLHPAVSMTNIMV